MQNVHLVTGAAEVPLPSRRLIIQQAVSVTPAMCALAVRLPLARAMVPAHRELRLRLSVTNQEDTCAH